MVHGCIIFVIYSLCRGYYCLSRWELQIWILDAAAGGMAVVELQSSDPVGGGRKKFVFFSFVLCGSLFFTFSLLLKSYL